MFRLSSKLTRAAVPARRLSHRASVLPFATRSGCTAAGTSILPRQSLVSSAAHNLSRRRSFSAMASATDAAAAGTAKGKESSEKSAEDNEGFFSRNPGVVVMTVLGALIGFIVRSSRGKRNMESIQNEIADAAVISPFEAYELRSNNPITGEVFKRVAKEARAQFPGGRATFEEFDLFLGGSLRKECPQGIKNGHLLERVLKALPVDNYGKSDVRAMLTAFAIAVKEIPPNRLECLFDVFASEGADAAMSKEELMDTIDSLLQTYQIPSEKRVAPTAEKWPIQIYESATAEGLADTAIAGAKKGGSITNAERFALEEFQDLMVGREICVWGECFLAHSKKRSKS